ncbi:MAG: TonB-dependent receptor, partial [Desulfobacterales bacterium]
MKKSWISSSAVLLGLGLVFGGFSTVFAQEEEEKKQEFVLDEIIVTAERRESNVQDTPVAVSAWDRTALDEEAIDGIQDLQMRMPSTQFTFNKIYIRGVGRELNQLGVDPGVGVYYNGYYSTEQGFLWDLFDIERIESVRGPQSTLFGRNTIGGAVLLESVRPGKEVSGQVKVTIPGEGGHAFRFAVGGPITEDKKLRYRFAVRDRISRGFMENIYSDDYLGGWDGTRGTLGIIYEPSDRLQFYGWFWVWTWQTQTPPGIGIGGGISPDPYPQDSGDPNGFVTEWTDPDTGNIGAIWWWHDANGDLTALAVPSPYYNLNKTNPSVDNPWKVDRDTAGFNDFDGIGGTLTTTFEATPKLVVKHLQEYHDWYWYALFDYDASSSPFSQVWEVPMDIYAWSQELQVIYGGEDTRLSFIGGLYYYFKHENQGWRRRYEGAYASLMSRPDVGWGYVPHSSGDGRFVSYDSYVETEDKAVYGQMDYQVTDKLNVTLGLRYTTEDKSGWEHLYLIWNTPTLEDGGWHQVYAPLAAPLDSFSIYHTPDAPAAYSFYSDAPGPWGGAFGDARTAYGITKPSGPWTSFELDQMLEDTWAETIGKVGMDYKPSDDSLLYGSISRGYKGGGFRLGSWEGAVADGDASASFDPEFLIAYEIGYKRLWVNDRYRTNFAA